MAVRYMWPVYDDSLVKTAKHQVYCPMGSVVTINIATLPWCSSHHWWQVIAINGRFLSATDKMTKWHIKVSTYDDVSHAWTSYYPDPLSVRSMPRVVCHQKYVIVAGGKFIARWWHKTCIIILKLLSWRKIPIGEKCPCTNCLYPSPILFNDHLLI